jgi:hypothetical protein
MLGVGSTVKLIPLLATPSTVTTTLPVVAFAGTCALMLVALQLVAVAPAPLKLTVLLNRAWVAPKLLPAIIAEVPVAPTLGERLVMAGGGGKIETVKGWFAERDTLSVT